MLHNILHKMLRTLDYQELRTVIKPCRPKLLGIVSQVLGLCCFSSAVRRRLIQTLASVDFSLLGKIVRLVNLHSGRLCNTVLGLGSKNT